VPPDEQIGATETADLARAAAPDKTGDSDTGGAMETSRETRVLDALAPDISDAAEESEETGPSAEMSGPAAFARPYSADAFETRGAADTLEENEDLEATVQRESLAPPLADRPRHNTLTAITRQRGTTDPNGHDAPPPPAPTPPEPSYEPAGGPADEQAYANFAAEGEDFLLDETEGAESSEGEWAIPDQPTVTLSQGAVLSARPQYLETDEHAAWPPRPDVDASFPGSLPEAAASLRRRAIPRIDRTGQQRYASPTGQPMPGEPPQGYSRAAIPDPRMARFQELHRRRDAMEHGEPDPRTGHHMTDRVRQWWSDLRPGLKDALAYQHEARASGTHPIPASAEPSEPSEPSATSRLGDMFGRLTASARDLTERAQSAAAPAFRRIHNQAEQAAQAIVGRFENDPARQQAPFLGPGRIAVYFRSGVSVGQAQRLLSSNEARPLRIIPRKHGFLAYVLPGMEAQVSGRLKVHPYVRDVVYMAVDEYGDPIEEDDAR
jgi:hypothetical protein